VSVRATVKLPMDLSCRRIAPWVILLTGDQGLLLLLLLLLSQLKLVFEIDMFHVVAMELLLLALLLLLLLVLFIHTSYLKGR